MKIAVNTRLLLPGRIEGISRFMFETLSRVVASHPEHEFLFLFDRMWSEEFVFNSNVTPVKIPPPARHPFLWYLWHELAVPYALRKHKADLFYSPDGILTTANVCTNALTLHDINFVHNSSYAPGLVGAYYRHYVPKFLANSARVSTVSKYSAQDIAREYGLQAGDIDVVYNATSSGFKHLSEPATPLGKRLQTLPGYFLFVGRIHERKNPIGLVRAFAKYLQAKPNGFQLVFAGATMYNDGPLFDEIQKLGIDDNVIFTGRLTEEELNDAYSFATALTFVPFFEGFGIPVIEAMTCQTPVVSSTSTSLPEVCADAAILVDPHDIDGIARAMEAVSTDSKMREDLVKKGLQRAVSFNWDSSAVALWNSLEKAIAPGQ